MQQHPQIIRLHIKSLRNRLAIGLFEEHHAEDLAVLGWQLVENFRYQSRPVLPHQSDIDIGRAVGHFGRIPLHRRMPRILMLKFQ